MDAVDQGSIKFKTVLQNLPNKAPLRSICDV